MDGFGQGNYRKLIILVLIAVTMLELSINFARVYPDSSSYMKISQGDTSEGLESLRRMSMAAIPLTAGLVSGTTGIPLPIAYGIINSALTIAAVVAVFFLSLKLGLDEEQGFIASLLAATALPIILYSSSVLVDAGVYFSSVALIYLYFSSDGFEKSWMKFLAFIAVGFFGLISKQNVGIILAAIFVYSLFKKHCEGAAVKGWLRSLRISKRTLLACAIPVALFFVYILLIGLPFQYIITSSAHWSQLLGMSTLGGKVFYFLRSWVTAFGLLPVFALAGFLVLRKTANFGWHALLIVLGAAALFAFPVHTGRYTFVLFPSVIIFSTLALTKLFKNRKILYAIVYAHIILINVVAVFLTPANGIG
ncbi:MAG: hypothetical protein ACP5IG_04555 [Candidatus Micrarchaeia archaeon]